MHNNCDRAGAITLGAFGVLEAEEVRDGDGVWHLLMEEDIKDSGKQRCGMVCLIRWCHQPFSTPALTAEHDCQRKGHKQHSVRPPLALRSDTLLPCQRTDHPHLRFQSYSPTRSPDILVRTQEGACIEQSLAILSWKRARENAISRRLVLPLPHI